VLHSPWRFCFSWHDIFAVLSPSPFFFVQFLSLYLSASCPSNCYCSCSCLPHVIFPLLPLYQNNQLYTFLRFSTKFEAHNIIVSFYAFLCPQSKQALLSHLHIHSYKPMLTFLFIDFHYWSYETLSDAHEPSLCFLPLVKICRLYLVSPSSRVGL
jgi:hypothetical protein